VATKTWEALRFNLLCVPNAPQKIHSYKSATAQGPIVLATSTI